MGQKKFKDYWCGEQKEINTETMNPKKKVESQVSNSSSMFSTWGNLSSNRVKLFAIGHMGTGQHRVQQG